MCPSILSHAEIYLDLPKVPSGSFWGIAKLNLIQNEKSTNFPKYFFNHLIYKISVYTPTYVSTAVLASAQLAFICSSEQLKQNNVWSQFKV